MNIWRVKENVLKTTFWGSVCFCEHEEQHVGAQRWRSRETWPLIGRRAERWGERSIRVWREREEAHQHLVQYLPCSVCVCACDWSMQPGGRGYRPQRLQGCVCVCVWGGAEGWEAIRLPWRQTGPWTLPLALNIYKEGTNQGHRVWHEGVCWVCIKCICVCVHPCVFMCVWDDYTH